VVGADAEGRGGAGAVAALAATALIFCPQEHDTLFPAYAAGTVYFFEQ